MKTLFAILFTLFLLETTVAQVGINTDTPHPSAALEIKSDTAGLLIPRVADTSMINNPIAGLMAFQNTDNGFYVYDGGSWKLVGKVAPYIADADGDTKIQVEENPDEDIIRFDVDGTQTMAILKTSSGNTRIAIKDPDNNIFLGEGTGGNINGGNSNTIIGKNAGLQLSTGTQNVFLGTSAGRNLSTGLHNAILGSFAGFKLSTGSNNTFIGQGAGNNNISGARNTFIGRESGFNTLGSRNLFIGYRAGANEIGSDKLYIESSNADSTGALIYGEFDKDSLRFNAAININGNYILPTTPGNPGQSIISDGSKELKWGSVDQVFQIDNGLVRNTGNHGVENFVFGSDSLPAGNGVLTTDSLLFFDKSKAAFRVGRLNNSIDWSPGLIGFASFASGNNTRAAGEFSAAMGDLTKASGSASTAVGRETLALGTASTAMGDNSIASGDASTAMGKGSITLARASTAMGEFTTASGSASTAMGVGTTASSFGETALGTYNSIDDDANPDQWDPADRLFTIGNGTFVDSSNALIVYKNGQVEINDAYILPDSLGIPGQAIISDGSKELKWGSVGQVFQLDNGLVRNTGNHDVEDFVFGSDTLPAGNGMTTTDTLFFFDKSKAAFRVGSLSNSSEWSADNIGFASFASGHDTKASGKYSTAMGDFTIASGQASTALGFVTLASGTYSTAMGQLTLASGGASTAMGESTRASGTYSTAMGYLTTASGYGSTAMGLTPTASGYASTAMGWGTTASAYGETALGNFNTIDEDANPGEWVETDRLFTIGNGTFVDSSNALIVYKNGQVEINDAYILPESLGNPGQAIISDGSKELKWGSVDQVFQLDNGLVRNTGNHGVEDFVFGSDALPAGNGMTTTDTLFFFDKSKAAFRVGRLDNSPNWSADSIGFSSFASGHNTKASGSYSTAFGDGTNASSSYSTALGFVTKASGIYSTTMGANTRASGSFSTAMGSSTTASGSSSTSMGSSTTASGTSSTAMGSFTTASGTYSTAVGQHTTAGALGETAIGMYNTIDNTANPSEWVATDRLFTIGNGTDENMRSNALAVYKDGSLEVNGPIIFNGLGTNNIGIGESTLDQINNGFENIAIGNNVLSDVTSGGGNIGIGIFALEKMNGFRNIGLGTSALRQNSGGEDNIAIGDHALENNLGKRNVAIGTRALKYEQSGNLVYIVDGNVAIGYEAGYNEIRNNRLYIENSNAGPDQALIYGNFEDDSLQFNATVNINGNYILPTSNGAAGQVLVSDGSKQLTWGTTTALSILLDTDGDTKIQVEEGNDDDIIRFDLGGSEKMKLMRNSNGLARLEFTNNNNNVFIGNSTGNNNNGTGNVFIGPDAGNFTTGNNKLVIENDANTVTNESLIYGEFDNNILRLNGDIGIDTDPTSGNKISVAGGANCDGTTWNDASDIRLKKDIKGITYGINDIMQLRPVSYTMKLNEARKVGFIAQEIQKIIPEVVSGIEGDLEKGETLSMSYGHLTAILVKGMQEQQALIDAQQNEIEKLQSALTEMEEVKVVLSAVLEKLDKEGMSVHKASIMDENK